MSTMCKAVCYPAVDKDELHASHLKKFKRYTICGYVYIHIYTYVYVCTHTYNVLHVCKIYITYFKHSHDKCEVNLRGGEKVRVRKF